MPEVDMKILRCQRRLQGVAFALLVPLAGAGADPSPATYEEAHRPLIHFSPPAMWMNDPTAKIERARITRLGSIW